MGRMLTAAVVSAVALAVVPAGAAEEFQPLGEEIQSQAGTIAAPTRFPNTGDPANSGGFPGLARRLYNASALTNGSIAYIFNIDAATWGGAFTVTGVKDATGAGDLDVFFYDEFGDVGGQVAGVVTGEYATRKAGGEVGFVPEGTRKVIVFTPNAVNAEFTYTGYAKPVIEIGKDALDLTVPAGATVDWLNATADYSFVRHTPTSGKAAFDSSPKPGTGIPVGSTFSHTFAEVGTFTYETSAGTGTITVSG